MKKGHPPLESKMDMCNPASSPRTPISIIHPFVPMRMVKYIVSRSKAAMQAGIQTINPPVTGHVPYATMPGQEKNKTKRDSSVKSDTSSMCQTSSNVSLCPFEAVTMTACSQGETVVVNTPSVQMSFPETVSDSLCRSHKQIAVVDLWAAGLR